MHPLPTAKFSNGAAESGRAGSCVPHDVSVRLKTNWLNAGSVENCARIERSFPHHYARDLVRPSSIFPAPGLSPDRRRRVSVVVTPRYPPAQAAKFFLDLTSRLEGDLFAKEQAPPSMQHVFFLSDGSRTGEGSKRNVRCRNCTQSRIVPQRFARFARRSCSPLRSSSSGTTSRR